MMQGDGEDDEASRYSNGDREAPKTLLPIRSYGGRGGMATFKMDQRGKIYVGGARRRWRRGGVIMMMK